MGWASDFSGVTLDKPNSGTIFHGGEEVTGHDHLKWHSLNNKFIF